MFAVNQETAFICFHPSCVQEGSDAYNTGAASNAYCHLAFSQFLILPYLSSIYLLFLVKKITPVLETKCVATKICYELGFTYCNPEEIADMRSDNTKIILSLLL